VRELQNTGATRNGLGFDEANNRLYYANNADNDWQIQSRPVTTGAVPTLGDNASAVTATTNVRSLFGTLWPGGATSTTFDLTGAATISNGRYYFIPDAFTGSNSPARILSFAISPTGSISDPQSFTISQSLGNYGDMVINGATNTAYTTSSSGFSSINLSTGQVNILNTGITGRQLTYDSNGDLWIDNNAASIQRLNPTNGSIIQTLNLVAAAGTTLPGGFNDLAGPSPVAVPEPTSIVLLIISNLMMLIRRRY
jgi:hypothetical protein